ncbi:MAG: hypothetical protein LBP73_08430, partial [Clostridiales Family XIII bacterium]|nr:hypothetical protein [Clostridiales Family XIII bacterium]
CVPARRRVPRILAVFKGSGNAAGAQKGKLNVQVIFELFLIMQTGSIPHSLLRFLFSVMGIEPTPNNFLYPFVNSGHKS